jgi:hypothetical protein
LHGGTSDAIVRDARKRRKRRVARTRLGLRLGQLHQPGVALRRAIELLGQFKRWRKLARGELLLEQLGRSGRGCRQDYRLRRERQDKGQ